MVELTLEGKIRKDILDGGVKAKNIGAHLAPSLSLVEICLAILKNFKIDHDVFVLSKAHGALGYYSTMHQLDMISDSQMNTFEEDGGDFPGQPSRSSDNHIDYSGGSLGMGLPYAVGRAWANRDYRTYVILGDGELDEGSNWEAAAIANKLQLNNLIVVIDHNGYQSDGKCSEIQNKNIKDLWIAHGWNTITCDGHNTEELEAIINGYSGEKPLAIIAETIKGKGVSFMEGHNEWHHHVLKSEQYEEALVEIGERYGLRKK